MSDMDINELEERIQELEEELQVKERDLSLYQEEVFKLNKKLENFIQQASEQIQLIHALHKALVPTELPNISGFDFSVKFEASLISGGDYYDIFDLEGKFKFALLLASSSGYGMSAIFLSILLKLHAEAQTKKGFDVDQILKGIKDELIKSIPGPETASLFYGVVDRKNFELKFGQVGDHEVFYYDYAEDAIKRLDHVGPAFSKEFNQEVKSSSITLNPRDRVILCSPGVMSAKNEKNDTFGWERLYKTVVSNVKKPCHELRNEILFQVKSFMEEKELERDMTVIVMEVQDRVIKLAKS